MSGPYYVHVPRELRALPFDHRTVAPEDWQYLGDLLGEPLPPDDVAHISRSLHYAGGIILTGSGDEAVATLHDVELADPSVPVLYQSHVRGYPAEDPAKPPKQIKYVPRSLALSEAFPHDAHTHGYSVPDLPYRLRKPALSETAVPMVTIFWDLDDPEAHAATGGTLNEARPEWRAETLAKIARLAERHPDPFIHGTKRGMRVVYGVDGWTIANPEDEARWCTYVLASAEYLRREYDIDADPCSRQWWNEFRLPFVRRNGTDQRPHTIGHPAGIGIWRYTPTAGDVPSEETKQRKRTKRDPSTFEARDPNASDSLIDRAGRVGLLGKEITPGLKYAVTCPNHRQHSTGGGDSDTSTVIWRGGPLHCSHAHCLDIGRADLERLVAARESKLVTLEEVEPAVHEVLSDSLFGPPTAVVVPPGTGKSRSTRSSSTMRIKPSILTDTHALATQTRAALLADHELDFRHEASVTATLPGRESCAYPKAVAEVQRAGLPVGQYACAHCPKRRTCKARESIGGTDGLVSVHALVGRANEDRLLVIDEEPALTEKRTITPAIVRRAFEALESCDVAFRDAVGPWVRSWVRVLDGELEAPDEAARVLADGAATAPDRNLNAKSRPIPVVMGPDGMPEDFEGPTDALRLNKEWLRQAGALAMLRFAAKAGAKITRNGDGWTVRSLSPALERFADPKRPAARVLLTATPTLLALRAVVPDLVVMELRVPDVAGVARTLVTVSDLQSGKASIDRVVRYVDDALGRAFEAGCTSPFVVVAKRFREAIAAHVGGNVAVGHFGLTIGSIS